jgi:hypothetical protein
MGVHPVVMVWSFQTWVGIFTIIGGAAATVALLVAVSQETRHQICSTIRIVALSRPTLFVIGLGAGIAFSAVTYPTLSCDCCETRKCSVEMHPPGRPSGATLDVSGTSSCEFVFLFTRATSRGARWIVDDVYPVRLDGTWTAHAFRGEGGEISGILPVGCANPGCYRVGVAHDVVIR